MTKGYTVYPYHTVKELKGWINSEFGMSKPWPEILIVSHMLYLDALKVIREHQKKTKSLKFVVLENRTITFHPLAFGPNGGLMYNNMELISDL